MKLSLRSQFFFLAVPLAGALMALFFVALAPYPIIRRRRDGRREAATAILVEELFPLVTSVLRRPAPRYHHHPESGGLPCSLDISS